MRYVDERIFPWYCEEDDEWEEVNLEELYAKIDEALKTIEELELIKN